MPGRIRAYTGKRVHAEFEMDYPGIARYAVSSHQLADALHDLADAGMAYAEEQSPRATREDDDGGHYADKWQADPYIETRVGVPAFPRGAVTLANTSQHALEVEFGNGHSDGYRIFPKVLDFLKIYGRR